MAEDGTDLQSKLNKHLDEIKDDPSNFGLEKIREFLFIFMRPEELKHLKFEI
jgi:hypothetical protein